MLFNRDQSRIRLEGEGLLFDRSFVYCLKRKLSQNTGIASDLGLREEKVYDTNSGQNRKIRSCPPVTRSLFCLHFRQLTIMLFKEIDSRLQILELIILYVRNIKRNRLKYMVPIPQFFS